jgi:integrase
MMRSPVKGRIKMPRTGENIYKLADGRWAAPLHHEGRRLKVYYGKTRREAKEKRDAGRLKLLQGGILNPSTLTVEAFLKTWLSDVVKVSRSPSTLKGYTTSCKRMYPHIGKVKLGKLSPSQIQGMLAHLVESGLSPETVHLTRRVLRTGLNYAKAHKLITENPVPLTVPPNSPKKDYKFLNEEEAMRFLKAASGTPYEALMSVAVALGLRMGETLSLRWSDVDLDSRRIEVRGTKTRGSHRTLPIPPELIPVLKRHRAIQQKMLIYHGIQWKPDFKVFLTSKGVTPHESTIRRAQQRLLEKAGIGHMRFHDLRHSCASLLLAQGVPMKAVQEILGHATVNITLSVYGHLMPGVLDHEMSKMGRFFPDSGDSEGGTLSNKASGEA